MRLKEYLYFNIFVDYLRLYVLNKIKLILIELIKQIHIANSIMWCRKSKCIYYTY